MLDSCTKHPHEKGASFCGRCGHPWCTTCLVYAFGAKKPPLCMGCAMVAGGVKTAAAMPAMPRRQLKAQMKAMKAHAKNEAKAEAKAAKAERSGSTEEPPVADEAASGGTDWSAPWWEDRQPAASVD
jgi:hypothetical protein